MTEDRSIEEFRDASYDDQRAMMFDSLMNLLTEAVADKDTEMIGTYARLVTEMWNDYEE